MIRSTRHKATFANAGKRNILCDLLQEGRGVASLYLDFLWDNGCAWKTVDKKTGNIVQHVFDVSHDFLEHPSMLSNVELEARMGGIATDLSARVRKCILTQVLGMIGAATEKQRKRIYQLDKNKAENRDNHRLLKTIKQNQPRKPSMNGFRLELNSICADFEESPDGHFLGYLQLKSLGKPYAKIRIPVNRHRACEKFASWDRLKSFLISENEVHIRYEVKTPTIKTSGETVGIDQGLLTTITLSDGTEVPSTDSQGHTLESVTRALARRKKGSRSFKRAQEHRKNLINYQINNTDFSHVKQINLEKIWNIGYKNKRSRFLSHWCNTLIVDKLQKTAEERGVLVKLQSSTYRSQRCSSCGVVRKANRRGKFYKCSCGNEIDSDLNAAKNHAIKLPEVPYALRESKKNREGFYWKPEGFFTLTGEELTVPRSNLVN